MTAPAHVSPFCACPTIAPCEACRAAARDLDDARRDQLATLEGRTRRRHGYALERREMLGYYATWPEVAGLLHIIDDLRARP